MEIAVEEEVATTKNSAVGGENRVTVEDIVVAVVTELDIFKDTMAVPDFLMLRGT